MLPSTPVSMSQKIQMIAGIVGLLWAIYALSLFVPSINEWGIVPRSIHGLPGIMTMSLLHGSLGHLLSNSFPLFVLLLLLSSSRPDPVRIALAIQASSGMLLWLIGRNANHIGASVLIYGLITFLLLSGIFEARPLEIAISVAVLLLFGGTLVWGILPVGAAHVSWEGHLSGAVMGSVMAWLNRRESSTPTKRLEP